MRMATAPGLVEEEPAPANDAVISVDAGEIGSDDLCSKKQTGVVALDTLVVQEPPANDAVISVDAGEIGSDDLCSKNRTGIVDLDTLVVQDFPADRPKGESDTYKSCGKSERTGPEIVNGPTEVLNSESEESQGPKLSREERRARLSSGSRMSASQSTGTNVSLLLTKFKVCDADLTFEARQETALKSLSTAVFKESRWANAVEHVKASGAWSSMDELIGLMALGAKSFGFWQLPDETLKMLAKHVVDEPKSVTPALRRWVDAPIAEDAMELELLRGKGKADEAAQVSLQERLRRISDGQADATMGSMVKQNSLIASAEKVGLSKPEGGWAKWYLFTFIFLVSNANTIEAFMVKYPHALDIFGAPLYVARVCGMGILLWTAALFVTMSRTLIRFVVRCFPYQWVFSLVDQHKELHIFCAKQMIGWTVLHIVAHSVGTVPGMISHTLEEVNAVLGCANPDTTPGYYGFKVSWLQWPECPLTSKASFLGLLFLSTPGLSGVLLTVLLLAIGYTASQARRKKAFDIFYYVHIAGIPLWLVLLFVHGSNGWVGVGFPLVVFVCSGPVAIYSVDRLYRALRYCLGRGKELRVADVLIRPGHGGQVMGSLIYLSVTKPRFMWPFREGMYAFLNLPRYAPLQWHAFTICSGSNDKTVDFVVQVVGDWTSELGRLCMESHNGRGPPLTVAMDGPFIAPTVSALSNEVIVAVGAGVGVTPFLSLMSTIVSVLGDPKQTKPPPLKEAHFYWMTRNADELLFGRRLFTHIASNLRLKGKVFLHLHVTHRASDKDVAAFMFREAVRRQSLLDRAAWLRAASPAASEPKGAKGPGAGGEKKLATQLLPGSWIHGGKEDVLYVNALLEATLKAKEETGLGVKKALSKNWAKVASSVGSKAETRGPPLERIPGSPSGAKIGGLGGLGGLGGRGGGGFFKMLARLADTTVVDIDPGLREDQAWLPVIFGRPDFSKEISAIGHAWPTKDVHIYACGNDGLVKSLDKVREECMKRSQALRNTEGGKRRMQGFFCHFERFD